MTTVYPGDGRMAQNGANDRQSSHKTKDHREEITMHKMSLHEKNKGKPCTLFLPKQVQEAKHFNGKSNNRELCQYEKDTSKKTDRPSQLFTP